MRVADAETLIVDDLFAVVLRSKLLAEEQPVAQPCG